jgi:hypothetical protein
VSDNVEKRFKTGDDDDDDDDDDDGSNNSGHIRGGEISMSSLSTTSVLNALIHGVS